MPPRGCPGLHGYIQNHSILRDGRPVLPGLRFDVCAELTFASPDAMDTAFTSSQYTARHSPRSAR